MQTTVLQNLLSVDLRLKLYANNYAPSVNSVIASFTEVSGGGYAAIPLLIANWGYSAGSPVIATQSMKTFGFTGVTGGSGVVYGWYITNVANTVLYCAEAFPGTITPFTPSNGASVRIIPTIACSGGA
jgi:hypothetical protein